MLTMNKHTMTSLEEVEDVFFSAIAEERMKKGGKYISHERFWKIIFKEKIL